MRPMTLSQKNKGIFHIVLAALCFSLMSFFIRLSGDLPSFEKAFFRNLVAAVVAAVLLARSPQGFRMKKGSLPFLLARSIAGSVGIVCNFYAVDHLPISDANMLNKLSPFFAIIFSYFLLKEKANKTEWSAVIVAFVGALFVIRPTMDLANLPALLGALGGLGAGIAYTFVRMLGKRGERGPFIVFFFSAFSTLLMVPFMLADFKPMTGTQLLFLLLTGAAAMGGQLNITAAYTCAPAKEISVFDYSQILFAALLGFFFLGQIPDVLSFIGYAIIIGAAVFRWWVSNKKGN